MCKSRVVDGGGAFNVLRSPSPDWLGVRARADHCVSDALSALRCQTDLQTEWQLHNLEEGMDLTAVLQIHRAAVRTTETYYV